jgi:hypothetical protein
MLSLGARAEVLAPEELRDRILDAARGIVRAYADRPDREPASAALSAPALSVPAPGEVAARPPARGRR